MLIFVKGRYLSMIRQGRKTTTIRPWRTCSLRPGGSLSFNGQIRTTLTKVEQRPFAELTDDDARRDGFPSRAALRSTFRRLYPTTSLDAVVWVLTFERPQA